MNEGSLKVSNCPTNRFGTAGGQSVARVHLRGFSLTAVLIVLFASAGIVGTALFIGLAGCDSDKANWEMSRTEIGEIQKALNQHAENHEGAYPESLDELSDKLPGGKVPTDPFSKEAYQYEVTEDGFTITCLGRDGVKGGAESPDKDIVCTQEGIVSG